MALVKSDGAKKQLKKKLREQGYATYARLLDLFDVYLTDDPKHIAYMYPGKAVIVMNKNLNIDQVSTLVRHEILHEYLAHKQRQERYHSNNPKWGAGENAGNNPAFHKIQNIAGDFEISNKGYTDRDKSIARAIKLGDQVLRGLVTEDQYPGWENMSFEEMYEKLLEENKEDIENLKKLMEMIDKLNPEDLGDLQREIEKELEKQEQQGEGSGSEGEESDDGDDQDSQSGKSGKKSDKKDSQEDNSDGEGSEAGDDKSEEISKQIKKALDGLEDELEDAADQADEIKDKGKNGAGNDPFMSGQKQRDLADVAARVAEIERAFKDVKMRSKIEDENRNAQRAEKLARAAREEEIDRVRGAGLRNFKASLLSFIQNEVHVERIDTYSRLHPSYEDSDIIVPGWYDEERIGVPSVNVYWDVSGSFSDPRKTASARQAIEQLNKYKRSGELKLNTWYFADRVATTASAAGGGTNGDNVLKHIEQTRPDNVIIITDNGFFMKPTSVEVPGTAWMLFYDGRTQELVDALHGKRRTLIFDINY